MKQILAAAAVCGLVVSPAFAVNQNVASAVKTFEATGNDAAKMKTYCEINNLFAESSQVKDEARAAEIDKKIQDLMKELGPDLTAAFAVGADLEPDSEDDKAYDAAVDALDAKCN